MKKILTQKFMSEVMQLSESISDRMFTLMMDPSWYVMCERYSEIIDFVNLKQKI